MSFLTPLTALFAAAVAVPVLVGLYFLKLRRRPVAWPSTLLWQKAVRDLQANAPFQRIRNSWLLWLQLLLLLLLLLAFARPTLRGDEVVTGRVVVVVDRSASMNTTDGPGGDSRLQVAKDAAADWIDTLDGGSGVMVIAFADRAEVVQGFTTDRSRLRRAIASVQPTDQPSRLGPVWAVVQPMAGGVGDELLNVRVYSDLKLQDADEPAALPDGVEVEAVAVGSASPNNLGIVAASARRSYEDPNQVSVFARLLNASPDTITTNLVLSVDGQTLRTRQLIVPGDGGEASATFDLQLAGAADLEIEHDTTDALASDDIARLRLLPSRGKRVLVVSEDGQRLAASLRAAGAADVLVESLENYEGREPAELLGGDEQERWDLVVFDAVQPTSVPPIPSMSFLAAPPIEGLRVVKPEEQAGFEGVLTWRREHPLMRYVQLDDVLLGQLGRVVVPTGGTVLSTGLTGPAMAVVEANGVRHVVMGFDVMEGRWPYHWSFQVFMVNVMDALAGGTVGLASAAAEGAGLSYMTGQVAAVPMSGGPGSGVLGYDGPIKRLPPDEISGGVSGLISGVGGGGVSGRVRDGLAALSAFEKVGWYSARQDAVEERYRLLPVNLLNAVESDVRVGEALTVGQGSGGAVQAVGAGETQREVWYWFVWIALALLLLEWWLWSRRVKV